MPSFDYHCQDCIEKLGKPYEEVHKWLDEFMGDETVPLIERTRHRKYRHNKEGIEQVRKMWGDEAARAAEIHIRKDLSGDGCFDGNSLPDNKEHFVSMGLW